MTTRVFIRNLELMANIGVHGHEHNREQPVRINVELDVEGIHPEGDHLENVVDYEAIANKIRAMVGEGHVRLAENLAERIVKICFDDRRVKNVRVRVEKTSALPGAEAGGVEIERGRE
jgi:7,8-dihydroneopterin aldolase/epimerase/oxygenase